MKLFRTQSSFQNRVPMMESLECRQFMSASTTTLTPRPAPNPPSQPGVVVTAIEGESTQNDHKGEIEIIVATKKP
jgi:hypothetical protein